jgi:hypothetical protein
VAWEAAEYIYSAAEYIYSARTESVNGFPMIPMHKVPNCFHFFGCWAHWRSSWPLVIFEWCSASLGARVPIETLNTTCGIISICTSYHFKSLCSRFAEFNAEFEVCSLLQFQVHWNHRCAGTRGDKHWTSNVHTATPLGIMSGDVPCSLPQCMYSCTAIGWWSTETVLELFDTPMYIFESVEKF